MSELPPPQWGPPGSSDVEPGRWQRWQRRPRWLRWGAYVLAGFVGLGVLGAIVGDPDADNGAGVGAEILPPVSDPPVTEATPATTELVATTVAETTTPATSTTTTSTSTTTTTTLPPATTVPGSVLALDLLALIPVENENPDGYDRDLFSYGDIEDDRGCDTRAVVLIEESLTPAQVDPFGCAVVAGDWFSVYDSVSWSDPGELQVDHVVALKEAWDSGAWGWAPERRSAFGNDLADPRSLRAVTGSVNQAKGAADPSNWIPPNPDFVCTYLADWVSIKARWGLSMDRSEFGRIRNLLTDRCPEQDHRPMARHTGCRATRHVAARGCRSSAAPADWELRPVLSRCVHSTVTAGFGLRRHHLPTLHSAAAGPAPVRRRQGRRRMRELTCGCIHARSAGLL